MYQLDTRFIVAHSPPKQISNSAAGSDRSTLLCIPSPLSHKMVLARQSWGTQIRKRVGWYCGYVRVCRQSPFETHCCFGFYVYVCHGAVYSVPRQLALPQPLTVLSSVHWRHYKAHSDMRTGLVLMRVRLEACDFHEQSRAEQAAERL